MVYFLYIYIVCICLRIPGETRSTRDIQTSRTFNKAIQRKHVSLISPDPPTCVKWAFANHTSINTLGHCSTAGKIEAMELLDGLFSDEKEAICWQWFGLQWLPWLENSTLWLGGLVFIIIYNIHYLYTVLCWKLTWILKTRGVVDEKSL